MLYDVFIFIYNIEYQFLFHHINTGRIDGALSVIENGFERLGKLFYRRRKPVHELIRVGSYRTSSIKSMRFLDQFVLRRLCGFTGSAFECVRAIKRPAVCFGMKCQIEDRNGVLIN